MLNRRRKNFMSAPWWRRMISWMLKGHALSGTDNGAWAVNASTVESMVIAPCTRAWFCKLRAYFHFGNDTATGIGAGARHTWPAAFLHRRGAHPKCFRRARKCALAVRRASRVNQPCAADAID